MSTFVHIHEPGDPTLVLLHGTGGDEREILTLGRTISRRSGFLSIRGRELEGGLNRFFRRFSEGVFDIDNLKFRAHELADFVDEKLPDSRRFAVGFSNGANIAAAVLLLRPEVFHGAVLLAPMVPLEPDTLPDLSGKPVLMVCGEKDPIASRANVQTLATMFQASGAKLDMHWHAGAHYFGETEVRVASTWLAQQFLTTF